MADAFTIALKEGSKEAFCRIMDMYKDRIYGIAYRVTGSAQDAEDILQETFLKLWKFRQDINTEGELYPWIKRVALNMSIDYRRKKKREDKRIEENMEQPQEKINTNVQEQVTQLALDSLDEDKRSVFLLRVIGGYSYQEIAQRLGLSIGTVMSRLHRARKELYPKVKSLLGEEA